MGTDGQEPTRVARAALTEAEGRAILKARFEEAGFAIVESYRLTEGELDVELDGFDPDRRVGYELLTTEAGDRAEFTPAVVAAIERRMAAGELVLFLIDEADADGPALDRAARRFLERAARGASGG